MQAQPTISKYLSLPEARLSCRTPNLLDGARLHRLASEAGGLDVNSEYAYALIGAHFARTSVIAEMDGKPVGFISAYLLPDASDTLFVWQVAVLPHCRGQGVAQTMLASILAVRDCRKVMFIHTSVSPSNEPSNRMFSKFAASLGTSIASEVFLPREAFSHAHEEEMLLRIGPFINKPPLLK